MNRRNKNREIHVNKIQFGRIQIRKYTSKQNKSGNTNQKIQIRNYNSEDISRKRTSWKIQFGKYKSENTPEKRKYGNKNREIQFRK